MTNPFVGPTRFHGLPWESWSNSMGRATPTEDKPLELKPIEKNKAGVMKLPYDDMKIFGHCPERDSFSVVLCESCNMAVTPQALLHHYEMRHMNKDNHPKPEVVAEVTVPDKITAKVIKPLVKNPPTKVKTKKTPTKDKSKDGVLNPTPSLPISLSLDTSLTDPGSSKGETLQPVVALTPISGNPAPTRRPPRKHAPIKEREYDPDKHCGVVTPETMKPCTWSLTCKSHPMSLRRAVTGRSKPFDQLLADHRQAKEALLKQKKDLELQHSKANGIVLNGVINGAVFNGAVVNGAVFNGAVMNGPVLNGAVFNGGPVLNGALHPTPMIQLQVRRRKRELSAVERVTSRVNLQVKRQKREQSAVEQVTKLLLRLPELSLDVTPAKRVYLSCPPKSLVVKSMERPPAPLTATTSQLDVLAFTLNHPRALSASSMFLSHKIGGLVYTNRRMQIARQGLESCLHNG